MSFFNGLGWMRNAWVELENSREELKWKALLDAETSGQAELTEMHGKLYAYIHKGYTGVGI
jgi:hypothetical protein